MIADWAFYSGTYHGSAVCQDDFPFWAERADTYLCALTRGQYADSGLSAENLLAVKLAECAAADALYGAAEREGIAEERVGEHQVKYSDGKSDEQDRKVCAEIRRRLAWTGLLYRGVTVRCIPRTP